MTGTRTPDLDTAHKHSSFHRAEVEASSICGCFCCLSTFPPAAITEWIDEGETALCPRCPVDAVLGANSGFPITQDFLKRMHDRWF